MNIKLQHPTEDIYYDHAEWLSKTDYLTETLQTEPETRKQIFREMLSVLEQEGKCRFVYHRLAAVLFDGDTLE